MSTGLLTSFWYYRKFDFTLIPSHVPLVIDSGAFSAYTSGSVITMEDYAEWLAALPRPYDFAVTVDVLGDAETSLSNWRYMRDALGTETVPVLHYGEHAHLLQPYIEEGATRLALGGLAVSGGHLQVQAWCAHVFRWLREHAPHLPVHGLGIHMRSRLARLPWSSTDASSFTSAWRFARAGLWDYRKQRWVTVRLDGRDPYRHGALIRSYGIEPSEIDRATLSQQPRLARLLVRSEMRAAQDWNMTRGRAKVTDRYLVEMPGATRGDRVISEVARYLAASAAEHLDEEVTR